MDASEIDRLLTDHARRRAAQRGLSLEDIAFGLIHGQLIQRAGCMFIVVQRSQLREEAYDGEAYSRLDGLVLLLSESFEVITVYRRRRPQRHVMTKAKYDRRPRQQARWAA